MGPTFIWTGDRWQQSPDGIKGHEGQTWAVLQFDASGNVAPIRWQDNVTFAVAANKAKTEKTLVLFSDVGPVAAPESSLSMAFAAAAALCVGGLSAVAVVRSRRA